MSQDTAERFRATEPYVVISCLTPGARPARLRTSGFRRGVLRLNFHDVDQVAPRVRRIMGKRLVLFTATQARKIVAFVRLHTERAPDADPLALILCHCEAGISRSAAVAAALNEAIHGVAPPARLLNRRVYRAVLKALKETT